MEHHRVKRRRLPKKEVMVICKLSCSQGEQSEYFTNLQKYYDRGEYCDVLFRVEGHRFPAHKSVLLGYSCFFSAVVKAPMIERDSTEIVLEDTDHNIFRYLLDYLYGKPIEVPSCDLISLLGVASRYQILGLVNQSSTILANALKPENCCDIFSAADSFYCKDLRVQAFQVIKDNFASAARTEGFMNLSLYLVKETLSSDLILDCDESVVFEAALRWISYEPDGRSENLHQLLELVRFPMMDAGFLSDVVKRHEAMKSPFCQGLLSEAWEHQALVAAGRAGKVGGIFTPRRRSCGFQQATIIQDHKDAVSALTVFNGKLISGSWDSTIRVYDPESWACERILSDHTGPVRVIAVCDQRLISGSDDCQIKVWNQQNWTLIRTLKDHNDVINALCECPSSDSSRCLLASAGDDGSIKLWNTSSWICEITVHHQEHESVLSLAVCGEKLISGSDSEIRVWNTHTWRCEKILTEHSDGVWAMVMCESKLITGSVDSSIKVWNVETWECEETLVDRRGGPVYALCSLEGKVIVGSDEYISVWNGSWICERTLPCDGVWSLAVVRGRLVSGAQDGQIKIWV